MRGHKHKPKPCPTHGKACRQKRIYNTPGRECAHACKGCCPACLSTRYNRRFVSRTPMPTAR